MTDSNDSWDAFWAEVAGEQRTEVIRGIEVPVPTDLPLALEKRATDLEDSERFEDYAELVGRISALTYSPGGSMRAWACGNCRSSSRGAWRRALDRTCRSVRRSRQ